MDRNRIARELRQFHRSACYPEAMDTEVDAAVTAIIQGVCEQNAAADAIVMKMLAVRDAEIERLLAEHDEEWNETVPALRAEIERLRAAATAYLLEQTQENAKALAEAVGWVPRADVQQAPQQGRVGKCSFCHARYVTAWELAEHERECPGRPPLAPVTDPAHISGKRKEGGYKPKPVSLAPVSKLID